MDESDEDCTGMEIEYPYREDWDFKKVPDNELVACCYWEYARESKTIGMASDLTWCAVRTVRFSEEYRNNRELREEHERRAAWIEEAAAEAEFELEEFTEKCEASEFTHWEFFEAIFQYCRSNATAWQRFDSDFRKYMVGQLRESYICRPCTLANVGDLEQLWAHNSKELLKARAEDPPEYEDSEMAALYDETEPIPLVYDDGEERPGYMAAAFTVDFSNFTDSEITEEFAKWLASNRPAEWKQPKRIFPGAPERGRKITEYRVALERLGLMRLLHFHSPKRLAANIPAAWARYGSKKESFRRELKQVNIFLHKLFPFLPKEEKSIHTERFDVWNRPLQKELDEFDRKIESGEIILGD